MRFHQSAALFLATLVGISTITQAQNAPATGVLPTDVVAICGDSITEQHIYSADIEAYIAMCKPVTGARTEQFGWGGETAEGFKNKMPQFMLPFSGTVATTCYGMNDGHYTALTPQTADWYRKNTTEIVETLKKSGVHFIVLGTPGAVDFDTFNHGNRKAEVYNKTLAGLGDIDREIAAKEGVTFADVHQAMIDAMTKAKAKYGAKYAFAGPDGVHPGPNGHLVMAYAYLKALGFDGNIGTITVDLAGNTATGTDGHKIVSANAGVIDVESTRYPYCFTGNPESSDATTGVIEFCPFNEDLNRFKLVVNNPGAAKLKVTFGPSSKEFSAEQLAKGINLASEFLNNPFVEPFTTIYKKIQTKQNIETALTKNLYNSLPDYEKSLPGAKDAYEALQPPIQNVIASQSKAVLALAEPVKYQIKIEAVK
jgi:lysophospholipase L1-like esterase